MSVVSQGSLYEIVSSYQLKDSSLHKSTNLTLFSRGNLSFWLIRHCHDTFLPMIPLQPELQIILSNQKTYLLVRQKEKWKQSLTGSCYILSSGAHFSIPLATLINLSNGGDTTEASSSNAALERS